MGLPEGKGRKKNSSRGPVGITSKDSLSTDDPLCLWTPEYAGVDDKFLPGIYDHITMIHIIPKLCWTDTLSRLPSVSRTWLHGIRSHQIHAERVFSRSTETFIVLPCYRREVVLAEKIENWGTIAIALYSMKEDRCYELPPLPPFATPLPGAHWYTSVSLDGKVYVMEVHTSFRNSFKFPTVSSRILAFDVAGQGGWQPCANLQRLKNHFECGVLNGKIYVVGGCDMGYLDRSTGTSEVYNPKDNTWSWIKPLKYPPRYGRQVGVLGDKLVVPCRNTKSELKYGVKHENLEVYDPTIDEWTEMKLSLSVEDGWDALGVDNLNRLDDLNKVVYGKRRSPMFTANGKFYVMDDSNIYIYDSERRLWKYLHASSFTGIDMGPLNSVKVFPRQVLVLGEELVAVVEVEHVGGSKIKKGRFLLRSRGRLGGENREIVWQRAKTRCLDTLEGMLYALPI